jgi:hypothetical protein
VDDLTSIRGLICSEIHFYFLSKSGCKSALTVIPPLKNVLDAALMAAAYCGVSIAYQARDAIFGLVLLASSSGVSVFVVVNNELY